MYKKLICLVVVISMASLIGTVRGASPVVWTGGGSLWSDPNNWDIHVAPMMNTTLAAQVDMANANCTIDSTMDIECDSLRIAFLNNPTGEPANVDMTGGALYTVNGLLLGQQNQLIDNHVGIFNMSGGTADFRQAHVGRYGGGIINMTGGKMTLYLSKLFIPKTASGATGTGQVNLDGGHIDIVNDIISIEVGRGNLDIELDGMLTVKSDSSSGLDALVSDDRITAYDGDGTVFVHYYSDPGVILALGVAPGMNPDPTAGNTLVSPYLSQLSWTNPAPNQIGGEITCDVYLGDSDPNIFGQPSFDLNQIVFGESVSSVPVSITANTTYYWKVDCFDDSFGSPKLVASGMFTFTSIDNAPPVVEAGDDVFTWLTGGTVDVLLAGQLLEDDGLPEAASIEWSVLSKPDIASDPTFNPDAQRLDPEVTIIATGDYVLQLEADDTISTITDTLTIYVRSDSCEAAKAQPGFELLDGDADQDCDVDLSDLALISIDWLKDNSL